MPRSSGPNDPIAITVAQTKEMLEHNLLRELTLSYLMQFMNSGRMTARMMMHAERRGRGRVAMDK